VIPSTISSNVPGTDFTVGTDTALNAISDAVDRIKLSASGSRRRVFIIEVMGQKCGYLATFAAIAAGADAAYIFEEKIELEELCRNVQRLKKKMCGPIKRGIILRANGADSDYTTDFFQKLYSKEGKGIFDCRIDVLGYIQQSGMPSPFDRQFATKMTLKALNWLLDDTLTGEENSYFNFGLIGVQDKISKISSINECLDMADLKNRIPENSWWLSQMRPILKMMAHHDSADDNKTSENIDSR